MADTRGGICLSTTPATVIEGHFSPKLKTYYFLQGALPLVITVVGILLLPLWAIFGSWWAGRYYASLKMELTDRNVVIRKGVWFRQELTIPLDKIQDISVREGPLLSALGLLGLRIETAGQRSNASGQSEADLIGLMNAREMRDRILAMRDAQTHAPATATTHTATSQDLLVEIRDALLRIETKLDDGKTS